MLWKLITKILKDNSCNGIELVFLTGEEVNCGSPGEESTEQKLALESACELEG